MKITKFNSSSSRNIHTFEIQFGKKMENGLVYKNSIDCELFNKILRKIKKENAYSYEKEFSYIIYNHLDISLYINSSKETTEFQCLQSDGSEHTILTSNKDQSFDLKMGIISKKRVLLNEFEPRYTYHSERHRKTTSFNFSNLFYINFSTVYSLKDSGIEPIYQICITLPRKIRKDQSYIFKGIRKYIQFIQQTVLPFEVNYRV